MRTPIIHTVRGLDGSVREATDVYVRYRYFGTEADVYAAVSGGSPLTQPLAPNTDGSISGFCEVSLPLDIVEVVGGREAVYPWDTICPVQDAWTAPTLLNSWANFAGTDTAGYKILSNGLVVLKGQIDSGTALGTVAFTLPAGYRPAASRYFTVESNGSTGACTVEADGDVIPSVGSTTRFALDGVAFEAEQ